MSELQDLNDTIDKQDNKIQQLATALAVIQSEAERIQAGHGNVGHLVRCIHVQVNSTMKP